MVAMPAGSADRSSPPSRLELHRRTAPVWLPELATGPDQRFSGRELVLIDLASEDRPPPDPAVHLWVPRTLSPHATCTYSWMRPPSRSRRSGRTVAPEGGGVLAAGGR